MNQGMHTRNMLGKLIDFCCIVSSTSLLTILMTMIRWLGSLSKEVGHFQFGSQKSSKALHALDINKEKDYQYPFTKSYEPYDDLPVYDI